MNEINADVSKQVRVDNWGIFFLSRLQVFFNKTDYCDLTLQFEGNVQLKVHRLVMNACTEYFQFLEQTCEVVDDVLLMPPDLQADVILPIVNFMYTGMLEFQMSIFDKLYKTAELMNITVLLKLLEAQAIKRASQRSQAESKKLKESKNFAGRSASSSFNKRSVSSFFKRGIGKVATKSYSSTEMRSSLLDTFDNTPKPTRFEWPEDDEIVKPFDNMLDAAFDNISYTSEPLLTQEDEPRREASSAFDDIRCLPSNSKVGKIKDTGPVKESTLDIEELKQYAREQKIRSDFVDYEEDPDDPDYVPTGSFKRKITSSGNNKRLKTQEKENKETKINVTSSSKGPIDHTKIISEVLKKYPHLMKNNKNIRLKIVTNNKSGESTEVSIEEASKDIVETKKSKEVKAKVDSQQKTLPSTKTKSPQPETSQKGHQKDQQKQKNNTQKVPKKDQKQQSSLQKTLQQKSFQPKQKLYKGVSDNSTWICSKCSSETNPVEFVLYYLYRKHMSDVHHVQFAASSCKHCGEDYDEGNLLYYHMYITHGISPPHGVVFPKCNACSLVALHEKQLKEHMAFHAEATHLQCSNCKLGFKDHSCLKVHRQISGHNPKQSWTQFDCTYCSRNLTSSGALFIHMKTNHFNEAKLDGILSLDQMEDIHHHADELEEEVDEDYEEDVENQEVENQEEVDKDENGGKVDQRNVKVLSDVKLPSSQQEQVTSVASGIATSLGLVDIVVLDENQQSAFIVPSSSVENESQDTSANFILPQMQQQTYTTADIGSTDELVMVLTDHDYNDGNTDVLSGDNSNIVVLYSHPVEGGGQQEQYLTTNQGSLMLNSETGMIEIHSSTQGESIELIQKEIQSSQEASKDDDTKDDTKEEKELDSVDGIEDVKPEIEPMEVDEEVEESGNQNDVSHNKSTLISVAITNNELENCYPRENERQRRSSASETEKKDNAKQDPEGTGNTGSAERREFDNKSEVQRILPETEEFLKRQREIEETQREIERTQREVEEAQKQLDESAKTLQDSQQVDDLNESFEVKDISIASTDDDNEVASSQNDTFEEEGMEVDSGATSGQVLLSQEQINVDASNGKQETPDFGNNDESETTVEETETVEDSETVEDIETVEESETVEEPETVDDIETVEDIGTAEEETNEEETNEESDIQKEVVESAEEREIDEIKTYGKSKTDENKAKYEKSQKSQTEKPKSKELKESKAKDAEKSCLSILNDWEDTDSQQSEQENRSSVHKLINDWDDD